MKHTLYGAAAGLISGGLVAVVISFFGDFEAAAQHFGGSSAGSAASVHLFAGVIMGSILGFFGGRFLSNIYKSIGFGAAGGMGFFALVKIVNMFGFGPPSSPPDLFWQIVFGHALFGALFGAAFFGVAVCSDRFLKK